MQAEIGAEDAEHREGQVADQFMRQADGDLRQRNKQRSFAQQIGNDQIDACLLQQ